MIDPHHAAVDSIGTAARTLQVGSEHRPTEPVLRIVGEHILAEGIETEGHLQRALNLGATFGQGWLFGRPGPLPYRHPLHLETDPGLVVGRQALSDSTPVEAIEHLVP